MSSDMTQYGAKALHEKENANTKDSIRAVVDDISSRGQSDDIGITEFQARAACACAMWRHVIRLTRVCARTQMMVGRIPRIFVPAQYLHRVLRRYAKEPFRVTAGMTPDALEARARNARKCRVFCEMRVSMGVC
jgi:hypothetical protein